METKQKNASLHKAQATMLNILNMELNSVSGAVKMWKKVLTKSAIKFYIKAMKEDLKKDGYKVTIDVEQSIKDSLDMVVKLNKESLIKIANEFFANLNGVKCKVVNVKRTNYEDASLNYDRLDKVKEKLLCGNNFKPQGYNVDNKNVESIVGDKQKYVLFIAKDDDKVKLIAGFTKREKFTPKDVIKAFMKYVEAGKPEII